VSISSENLTGEIAALAAAALWAISSAIYSLLGQKIPPLLLNFLKGVVAIALIALTIPLSGQWQTINHQNSVFILLTSGAIGIGIGDTAYFAALNYLGPRKTLLLETLSPPLGAILAAIFLGESLKISAYIGIILTILGVAWVISEKTLESINQSHLWQGIGWALMAAISQAVGAVLSRYALLESGMSSLQSTLLRLLAGTGIVLILMFFRRQESLPTINWSLRLIAIIIVTAFGSTFLGIWLQQTALKFSPVGIAQTLTATSPLFVLPIAAMMGDRINLRAIFGVIIALLGIGILFQ
jgi:drug/metabolite transporter (DMT)-like permease